MHACIGMYLKCIVQSLFSIISQKNAYTCLTSTKTECNILRLHYIRTKLQTYTLSIKCISTTSIDAKNINRNYSCK